MASTLVDSSVLLDVITEDATWFHWSVDALAVAADAGPLVINPIIYAEVSVRFSMIEELDEALPVADFARSPLPWPAAFLAAKAFTQYRRRGGARSSPMPDFFIGAHAAIDGHRLLTRDRVRVASYFPTVELISPA